MNLPVSINLASYPRRAALWSAAVPRSFFGARSFGGKRVGFSETRTLPRQSGRALPHSKALRARLRVFVLLVLGLASASAQTLHLYTEPVAGATGGISAKVDVALTHALALNRDRVQCFRAKLSEGGKTLVFSGLPTGKYDLVLVSANGRLFEGLALGEEGQLAGTPQVNFEKRVTVSDSFFNKAKIHRFAFIDGGEKALLLVERIRDKTILKQSGEVLNANLRRLEVMDLEKATDDWTLLTTRHIYREEAPVGQGMGFLSHAFVAALGNLRVIDTAKDLGTLILPK